MRSLAGVYLSHSPTVWGQLALSVAQSVQEYPILEEQIGILSTEPEDAHHKDQHHHPTLLSVTLSNQVLCHSHLPLSTSVHQDCWWQHGIKLLSEHSKVSGFISQTNSEMLLFIYYVYTCIWASAVKSIIWIFRRIVDSLIPGMFTLACKYFDVHAHEWNMHVHITWQQMQLPTCSGFNNPREATVFVCPVGTTLHIGPWWSLDHFVPNRQYMLVCHWR